jgi:hypothetical protein
MLKQGFWKHAWFPSSTFVSVLRYSFPESPSLFPLLSFLLSLFLPGFSQLIIQLKSVYLPLVIFIMAKKKPKKASTQPLANGGSTTSLEDNMANLALGGVILGSPPPPRPSGKNIKNIVREFERYFGNDTKLENWVRLCRDVGIEGELTSINKCRQVTAATQYLPKNLTDIF